MKRSAQGLSWFKCVTMMVTALMYAFNSMIFQNEFTGYYEWRG